MLAQNFHVDRLGLVLVAERDQLAVAPAQAIRLPYPQRRADADQHEPVQLLPLAHGAGVESGFGNARLAQLAQLDPLLMVEERAR